MQRPAPGAVRKPGGSPGDRTGGPVRTVQRRRLPALIAVGMFLTLGCAAIGAALFVRVGQSTPLLAIKVPVAEGQVIQREHLSSVSVRLAGPVKGIPADGWESVVGKRANVALEPNTLLFPSQYSAEGGITADQSVVALALKPGQLPGAGLSVGDTVAVVHTPSKGAGDTTTPRTITDDATVRHVTEPESGDTIVVDLVTSVSDARDIAAVQALGEASLILLPAGR